MSGYCRVSVDDVAVARAVAGDRVPLNLREREAAVRRLHADRLSDRWIARRLGIAPRTVLRTRQRLDLAAVPAADRAGAW